LDTTVGRFFQGLPICFFSYSCHNSVFPVYHEMAHRTPHVFKKVTIANHVIAGLLYFVSG
jgi:amino acid permease